MGRLSEIDKLPEEHRCIAEACIRQHRYGQIDKVVEILAEQGISVARSSVHRHGRKLSECDMMCASPEEGTVVTIVERQSGAVRVVNTQANAEAVATLIATFKFPEPIS